MSEFNADEQIHNVRMMDEIKRLRVVLARLAKCIDGTVERATSDPWASDSWMQRHGSGQDIAVDEVAQAALDAAPEQFRFPG